MTNEEQRIIHKRYSELEFTHDENNAIYDCYMQGVNHDGHTWVTWTDVERLLCDLYETNSGRYRWHDLGRNPEDLPPRAGEYLVFAPLYKQIAVDEFDDSPRYSVQPYLKFANGMHWSGDICQDEVWLWKEIEMI